MSSYTKTTKHPITGEWHEAEWLDDYFGNHYYGVRFPSGEVFKADAYEWETKATDVSNEPPTEAKASTETHPDTPELDAILVNLVSENYAESLKDRLSHPSISQATTAIERFLAKRELEGQKAALEALHRYEGKGLPKRDYDNETDEHIDDFLAVIEVELGRYE